MNKRRLLPLALVCFHLFASPPESLAQSRRQGLTNRDFPAAPDEGARGGKTSQGGGAFADGGELKFSYNERCHATDLGLHLPVSGEGFTNLFLRFQFRYAGIPVRGPVRPLEEVCLDLRSMYEGESMPLHTSRHSLDRVTADGEEVVSAYDDSITLDGEVIVPRTSMCVAPEAFVELAAAKRIVVVLSGKEVELSEPAHESLRRLAGRISR